MSSRCASLRLLGALVVASMGFGAVCAQEPRPAERASAVRFDEGLDAEGKHEVFVQFKAQLLQGKGAFVKYCAAAHGHHRREMRNAWVRRLRSCSETSWMGGAGALVRRLQDDGSIQGLVRTWIVNGFFCSADAKAVRALAARYDVDFIFRQTVLAGRQGRPRAGKREIPPAQRRALARAAAALESPEPALDAKALAKLQLPWSLKRIGAPAAWKHATGRGVTIAVIDTGLCDTPSLTRALWRNPREKLDGRDNDGNGKVDDLFGWDFGRDNGAVLVDRHGHGSMCAGIAVGRPALGRAFGVAPSARLMVLRGGGILRAYEYALEHGADVLSMSYMWVGRELGNFRAVYRLAHEHLCVAGVVAVGGAGNFAQREPAGRQIAMPKDIPCVLAAAGILENGELAPPSSRGPVSWKGVRGYGEERVAKPDLTACFGGFPLWFPAGLRLPKAWKLVAEGDGARLILGPRGNSFSGPHVAGAAALVLEVAPEVPAWRVRDLLVETAVDRGPEGHDTKFGAGLLRADLAVEAARRIVREARREAKKR